MGDFTPGVERAKRAGYAIDVKPYVGTGDEQVAQSLEVIATKIRNGRLDPDVRGWAGDTLIAAGRPTSASAKVQALLDAFRDSTMYVPDPVGAEYIASAVATACLRPGLCVRARDCDDGVVFMGSAILSIGIPVKVVKQSFGPGKQEHVLVEALSDDGSWMPVDPSTTLPVGEKVRAFSEVRIDPMDQVGSAGTSGPEIVSLGAVPSEAAREVKLEHGVWTERRYGQWWVYGVGTGWVPVGTGDACCAACAEGSKNADGTGHAGQSAQDLEPGQGAGHAGRSAQDLEPGQGTGDAEEGGEGCSACEAYAAKLRGTGKLARYGVSGAPRSASLVRFMQRGLGDPSDGPSLPPIPAPSSAPPPSIAATTVVMSGLAIATVVGIGWGIHNCMQAPRRKRRAA